MNPIIEQSSPSLFKRMMNETFLVWCTIFAGAIILNGLLMTNIKYPHGFFISLFPWMNAGGRSIENGLKLFSGNIPQVPNLTERLSYLISILCVFVVFPTLFFFGLRKRVIERTSNVSQPLFRMSSIQIILGGMVTLGVAIPSVPHAVIQCTSSKSLRSAQEMQSNRDQIMNEINTLAWKAREYRILPKELGGGNGSFAGFTLSSDFASTNSALYQVEPQDTLIVIRGSSKQFSDASITSTLTRDFKLREWRYTGIFQ